LRETIVWEREVKIVLEVGSERKGTRERRLMRAGSCVKGWSSSGLDLGGEEEVVVERERGDRWKRRVVWM